MAGPQIFERACEIQPLTMAESRTPSANARNMGRVKIELT
jgi:hypothetical protein